VEVALPAQCPRCGDGLEECATVSQFQTEIPEPRVERIEFRIQVGCCRRRMRRDGRWAGSCGGCRSSAQRRSQSMPLSRGGDLNKQSGSSVQTLPAFWCAMAGLSIAGFSSHAPKLPGSSAATLSGDDAGGGGKRGTEFPRQIQAILQQAIQLRDRRQHEPCPMSKVEKRHRQLTRD
jgi:hypothetical protein